MRFRDCIWHLRVLSNQQDEGGFVRMRVLTQLKLIMTLQGPKQSHQSQVYRHNNNIILQRN